MSNRLRTATLLAALAAMAACSSYGSGDTSYRTRDDASADRAPPTRSIDHPRGAIKDSAGGSVSGGMTPSGAPLEKEQRGNTPPGLDRDGHGPAAGAIVDPTGAATARKPY